MVDRPAPVRLKVELEALGWSAEQLIARINACRTRRRASPLHPKSAYPWLRGSRPSPDVMPDILQALADQGRHLTDGDLGWAGPRPRRSRRLLETPYNASVAGLLHETQGDPPMERRAFMLLSGAAVTAPALDLLIGGPDRLAAAIDGDRISPQLVASIEKSVRQVRDLDDAEGSGPALLWAGGLWQSLGRIITNGRYSSAEGARLHTAYVVLAETYGWMLFDSGHHPQAQRVYLTGLRLAKEAESDVNLHRATANLLASTAYQESWLGHHQEAATLLDVAVTQAPDALLPRVLAVLAQRRIIVAGRQGDSERVQRARDEAQEHLLDGADAEQPWWSTWLTPEAVNAQTGRAFLALHDPTQAEPYLARRVQLSEDSYPRDRMLAAADLADARLQMGDIDGAAEAGHESLDLAERVSSPRVLRRVETLLSQFQSTRSNHPAVRDLLARTTS